MLLEELIGRTITDIFQIVEYENYGMDKGECFIQLDNNLIVDIPHSWDNFNDEVRIKELNVKAISLFENLNDYPFYHVNKERKSIKEIVEKYADKKPSLFQKVKQLIGGQKPIVQPKHIAEYEPYKVEYIENKLKYVKDRMIKDLFTFAEDDEKYFLELDNGYYITETNFGMNGTGRVGLNVYDNLIKITNWKGKEFNRISDQKK